MSVEAITWALKQPVPSSPAKFVLVVLANQANSETMISHPSVKYLQDATGQDRKTVLGNLKRLIEWRLIEDAGTRVGRTKQVVEYRLRCATDLFSEVKSPKNGTVPKTGLLKAAPQESSTSGEGSQKRNSSENGTRNQELLKASLSHAREPEPPLPTFDPSDEPSPGFEPTSEGLACAAMKKAGLARVNPSLPKLLEALAAGVTIKELADTTTEVLGAHKGGAPPPGQAYICTTALNRRLDAAARAQTDANPNQTETRGNPRPTGRQSLADQAADRAREVFDDDD